MRLLETAMQMLWRRRFLRFLKEKGAYSEWVYNIRKQHPTTDVFFWNFSFKAIFSEEDKCKEAINYAFYWSDTRQGRYFWSKIDGEWIDKCRNSVYKIWFGKKNF